MNFRRIVASVISMFQRRPARSVLFAMVLASLTPLDGRSQDRDDLTALSLEELLQTDLVPLNVAGLHTHFAGEWMIRYLGRLYRRLGEFSKGEPLLIRALAIDEKVLGPDHPEVARVLTTLGVLYRSAGEYTKAEPAYVRALAIRERALEPDHPQLAQSLSNLAWIYMKVGRPAEAEPLYVRALPILENALGPDHPLVAGTLEDLGSLLRELERFDEAEPLEERARTIRAASGN